MKRFQKLFFVVGILLVLVAAGIIGTVSYLNSTQRSVPVVFSDNALLLETWNDYKRGNIDPNSNRTIDKSLNNLTTSEGQSYTMLRAVWMDDRDTFDKSWKFTQQNLQRPDGLFSWKYGQLDNGKYGILPSGGVNAAADADQDIALALLMAYTRWNDSDYLSGAKPIITSLWQKEVVQVQGKPVLVANDLERNNTSNMIVNPSYFSPANYKVFAKIDPTHDWQGLAANSYDLLNQLSAAKLDKTKSVGLPPDWVQIDRRSGQLTAVANGTLDTNFGFDAMRVPFRLALDSNWYNDGRAKDTLSRYGFLKQFWQNTGLLNATYSHDGTVTGNYESPAMYGASLGYFTVMEPALAKQIYAKKLQTLYSPDQQSWKAPAPGYYEDNWAWFGIALAQGALPNLTETQ